MQSNHSKFQPNKWSLLNLAAVLILAGAFYYLGQFSVFHSILLSLICFISFLTLLILKRWKAYINYLKAIGDEIERDRFHLGEHIVSMVPYMNLQITVHARMDESALLIKKANCYISINLKDICSFEPTEYFGRPIAKVILADNKNLTPALYVPWSEEMALTQSKAHG